jgi:HPt (histidine-containing phosphotransfer) domain-containing protein
VIDGVDAGCARKRLGGDVGLFTSMLGRLLDEFSDLGGEPVLDDSDLNRLAARMHALKGSAGTLGATAIQRLAAETELTCRAGKADQTAHLVSAVAHQLHQLQRSAAATLTASTARVIAGDVPPDAPPDAALDPAQLAALLQSLRQLDLAAVPRFAALSPQLRRRLGTDSYQTLHKQIEDLQFADAAAMLATLDP